MYSSFEDLYLAMCKLSKNEAIDLISYQDLDKYFKGIPSENLNKIEIFKLPGKLIRYENFPYPEKLDPDYIDDKGNKYIWHYSYEEEILLSMGNDKILNKWKLKQLELVSKIGWKKYCDTQIDKILNSF